MPLPPAFEERSPVEQIVGAVVVTLIFGLVTGLALGWNEIAYYILVGPIALLGGLVGGMEHRGGEEGFVRGALSGDPAVNRFQGGIQRTEDGVVPRVKGSLRRAWLHPLLFRDDSAAGLRHGRVHARADQGEERRSISRAFLRFERDDALVHHVSEQLPPEGAACSAA